MPPPALPPPVGDPPLPPEALAPPSPVQPAVMPSQIGKEQQRSLPPRSLLLQPSAGAVAELTGSRSPSVSPTTSLHPPPSSMSSSTSRPVRQLPARFAASSATTAAVADARGAAHPDSNATAAAAAAHHPLPVPTARHLHPLLAFAGIEDDADELEGLGENESAWDEGFHPTTTSLPKKRKIPSAHSLGGGIGGGANSNAGGLHVTPSSPASSSSSSPPQLDAHALRMHAKYGSLGSRGGGGAWAATASSAAFAHFPSLPRGFISAPRPVIPVPLASVSRAVVDLDQGPGPQFGQPQSARRRQLQHPYPRASPPARAYLWAKAVWAERKRLLSAKLCVEPDGGEGWLAPDEEKAVEFGGSVWGRGWENVESGNGGSGGGGGGSGRSKTPPIASNTASISRRRKRRLAAGHEPDARREGAMRGVRELLTKDGLSITAVVREEIDWSVGKRKALSASSEFEDKAFEIACESEATTHIGEIIDLLGSLRDRLKSAVNLLRDLAPALGADGLPLSDAECDDDDLELPGHRHPSSLLDHDGLATSDQHLQQPERFIDVGMQTLPVPPKPEDELLRGRVVTPSPRLPGGEPPTAVFSMSSEATETITTTTVVPPSQLPPPPPTKKKTGKKKRSALANAANPHHMKNYVPSRLLSDAPASSLGSGHHTSSSGSPSSLGGPGGLLSLLFPPPTRFLSATPRHKSRRSGNGSEPAPLGATVSSDEYVCVFCDYALFYSPDENRRRRTVGKRKKLLARRRRAKERASRGVAGKGKTLAPISRTQDDEDDEEDLCDGEEEGGKCRRCAERRSSEHGKKKGKKKKGRPKGGERAVAVATADGGVQTCDL